MDFDWNSFGIEKRSPVATRTIFYVQEALGVEFPESYIDLLKYANEAVPEISSFPICAQEATCVSEFFTFLPTPAPYSVLWYSRPNCIDGLPEKFLPIARDAGAYLICLNFEIEPASIEAFDTNSKAIFYISDSFEAFVNLWSE